MDSLPQSVMRRSKRSVSLLLIGLSIVLAVPASAAAAAFTARLHAPNHSPTANKYWPITIDVTRGKARLSGSVRYQFYFQNTRVSQHPGKKFTHGVCHDRLLFPRRAVGYPLTLRILVSTKYGTVAINWAVKTRT